MNLSTRDRRALTVGAVIVGALLLGSKGLPAWQRWSHASDASAVELRRQLAADSIRIARLPSTLDSLDARIERLRAARAALVVGETAQEGAAALGRVVTEAARVGQVRISGLRVTVDTAAAGALLLVTVELTANGDVEGLSRLLGGIEGGSALLSVEKLNVEAATVETPDDAPEDLSIRMVVSGLTLPSTRLDLVPAEEVRP